MAWLEPQSGPDLLNGCIDDLSRDNHDIETQGNTPCQPADHQRAVNTLPLKDRCNSKEDTFSFRVAVDPQRSETGRRRIIFRDHDLVCQASPEAGAICPIRIDIIALLSVEPGVCMVVSPVTLE